MAIRVYHIHDQYTRLVRGVGILLPGCLSTFCTDGLKLTQPAVSKLPGAITKLAKGWIGAPEKSVSAF